MKVLLSGAEGQVGAALRLSAPPEIELQSYGRQQLDITDKAAVATLIAREKPALVINAAAYTAVDAAETDAAACYGVNAQAAGTLARAADKLGARFVHISTDFVFSRRSGQPYQPNAPVDPISVYGASKAAGEARVRELCAHALIVRTAWVYSPGHRNFVETMLKLMAALHSVSVVDDQIGTPTSAATLATAIWQLAPVQDSRTLHVTDSGVASWYDFAVAVGELATELGVLTTAVAIRPIPTSAYPTPARRPVYSVLDKHATIDALKTPFPHWRHALRDAIRTRTELTHG